ncbi:MAG: tRNA pseudouridine(38-40) synthase TruA [Flavobacteriaceae bacterium]
MIIFHMKEQRHCYLIRVQFLGFRYSGWQKQPGQKTVESMLIKTLKFILPARKFKILGAGRTDAKVSALDAAFELFLEGSPLEDHDDFIQVFNMNLPPDIRVVGISLVGEDFNIIKNGTCKEYVYLFSFGQKNHPFCAPFLANIVEDLDIELMIKSAKLFEGTHDFSTYTARLQKNTKVIRTITSCDIQINTMLEANFFPKKTYALVVQGEGFMRYQIRMMMGALIQLGKFELSIEDLTLSLKTKNNLQLNYVAPGSGLFLNKLEFNIL